MLVFSLVYFSFFVDRTRLTADADIKRVTLDNEVTYLGNIIPSINDELSILSTNLGELQAIYGGDYDRREIIAKISNAESRIRDLYKQTDDVIARMLLDSLNPSIFVSNLSSDDKIDIAQRMSALDTGLREISENKEMLDVIFSNKAHELKVAKAKLAILKEPLAQPVFMSAQPGVRPGKALALWANAAVSRFSITMSFTNRTETRK